MQPTGLKIVGTKDVYYLLVKIVIAFMSRVSQLCYVRVLFMFMLLSSSALMAQGICLNLVIKTENLIQSNDNVSLMIIACRDTIIADKKGDLFCFPDTASFIGAMDVIIESAGETLFFDSLFPGFLKISDSPTWIVGVDRKPFLKENYPHIRWRGVKAIEYLEVQPQTSEGMIVIYRRKKDGLYVIN